jgi:type IV pilus assembly protein PilC
MAYAAAQAVTPGVSAQTLAFAFRGIASMLRAGLPLNQALASNIEGAPWHFQRALQDLAVYVEEGQPLSEGMRHYGGLFHPVIPAIVAAGETSGNLDYSFALLAEFFESEAELVRVLRSAMVYPTMVVITAIAGVFILSWIGFMPATWAVRLLWGSAAAVGLWLLLRFRTVQRLARYFAMLLPFFGGIIQELAVARFCLGLGLLTRAGVPYLEALEAVQPAIQHPLVERAARMVYAGVRNGVPLEECLRGQPVFPPIVRNLVGAGEASGTLDDVLVRAGQFLRTDAEYKIKNSAKVAGPVMVVILGAIVCLILISFWQHYFALLDQAGRE